VTLFTAAVNKREKQPTQKGTVWERASRQGPPPPHSRGSKTVIKETRLSFPFFTGIGTACMPVWSHGSSTVHTSVRYYGHWSFFKEGGSSVPERNGSLQRQSVAVVVTRHRQHRAPSPREEHTVVGVGAPVHERWATALGQSGHSVADLSAAPTRAPRCPRRLPPTGGSRAPGVLWTALGASISRKTL
jgi:hypothetical protein